MHSSLIKSAEFCNAILRADKGAPFLFAPSLRGICEDYISLKFIHDFSNSNKDKIVTKITREEMYKSAVSQWNFFKNEKPDQKLYYSEDFEKKLNDTRSEIRGLVGKHPYNGKNSLPSVRYMAEKINHLQLYLYIYHATSSLVHFNPRILMRMGWGDVPEVNFSTKNFHSYYKDFTIFYGCYLLVKMYDWLSSSGLTSVVCGDEINRIKNSLQEIGRWPELVTFEEMNVGSLSKILFYKSPSEID